MLHKIIGVGIMNLNFWGLFITILGYIIGFGSVIVIDIHGFLGRKSPYWTEATIRTHKVTKPLIWLGIFLVIIGEIIFFNAKNFPNLFYYLLIINSILILNGFFLSFYVSPFLLKRENEGKEKELLPKSLQNKIIISLIFSYIFWLTGLFLFLLNVLR